MCTNQQFIWLIEHADFEPQTDYGLNNVATITSCLNPAGNARITESHQTAMQDKKNRLLAKVLYFNLHKF